jgi:hypothetical protein
MHLLRLQPANSAQVRIQFRKKFRDGFRKLDADEEPLRAHVFQFDAVAAPLCRGASLRGD